MVPALPGRATIFLRTGFIAVATLALFSGCETQPTSAAAHEPAWIALERTPGGGPESPVYTVTLYEDGRVLFEGRSGVHRKGTFTKEIPRAKAAAIFSEIEGVDLWNRDPRYDYERAQVGNDDRIIRQAPKDSSWDILTARSRGRFKRIDGLFFAPHELIDLVRHVQETVGLSEWIVGPSQPKT
jgi:hypothetical protein